MDFPNGFKGKESWLPWPVASTLEFFGQWLVNCGSKMESWNPDENSASPHESVTSTSQPAAAPNTVDAPIPPRIAEVLPDPVTTPAEQANPIMQAVETRMPVPDTYIHAPYSWCAYECFDPVLRRFVSPTCW